MPNIYHLKTISFATYLVHIIKENPLSLFRKIFDKGQLLLTKFCLDSISRHQTRHFIFRDLKLPYISHPYNQSTYNERTVEVSVGLNAIKNQKNVLEIGAVLPHYRRPTWDVVDKFESGYRIINQDILNFKPKHKYDFIISLSTFEHIGFDDDEKDFKKVLRAIEHVKKYCLKKGGVLLLSLPLSYNRHINQYLHTNAFKMSEVVYLQRLNWYNQWQQVSHIDLKNIRYGFPFNNANGLAFCYFTKK